MNKNIEEERKCKMCGKTIVGNSKTGVCSACKKEVGDTSMNALGILVVIGGGIWTIVKILTKKD